MFQGRYKSLLVEPGKAILGLVDYIHLNPVRAGLLGIQDLKKFDLSSFPKLFSRKPLSCLKRSDFLGQAGFPDSPYGMKRYWEYLKLQVVFSPQERIEQQKAFTRGWAIASKEYKKQLSKQYEEMAVAKDWGNKELQELNALKWEERVSLELKRHGKTDADVASETKLTEWKQSIAVELRRNTPASNPWIARRLNMGHPSNISWSLRQTRKS